MQINAKQREIQMQTFARKCVARNPEFSTLAVVADDSKVEKAVTYQARVRPETRRAIEGIRKKTGIPAVEVVGRLLDWYTSFSEEIQAGLISGSADVRAQAARLALEKVGAESETVAGAGVQGALRSIRRLLDTIEQIDTALMSELMRKGGRPTDEQMAQIVADEADPKMLSQQPPGGAQPVLPPPKAPAPGESRKGPH